MKKRRLAFLLSFVLLFMTFSAIAQDVPADFGPTRNPQYNSYNTNTPGALLPEDLVAHSFILIERYSEDVLMARNETAQMFPASTTKVMTALVALKYGILDDIITVSERAVDVPEDSSAVGLRAGEELTLRDALYGLILRSGNEAANAIAEYISGDINAFVALMNSEAVLLGCTNTTFMNPHGYHEEGHQTTARDLALIMNAAMDHPDFRKIAGTVNYTMSPTNMNPARNINHSDLHLDPRIDNEYYYEYAIAGKTGSHSAAAHVLVEAAEKNGVELISVVMYTNKYAQWSDTSRLFNYGFLQYEAVTVEELYNENPIKVEIKGYDPAESKYVSEEYKEDYRLGRVELAIRSNEQNQIVITKRIEEIAELRDNFFTSHTFVHWDQELRAPITAGQVLGTLIFFSDEGPIEYELLAKRSVTARPDAPPTLDEIVARVHADPSPFPPFSLDWVLPPLLGLAAFLWAIRLMIRRIFQSTKGRKKIPKPTQRYFK